MRICVTRETVSIQRAASAVNVPTVTSSAATARNASMSARNSASTVTATEDVVAALNREKQR